MSLPLMAEGEFALLKEYLEIAGSKPVSARGLLFHDTELYSIYLDVAVRQRDQAALRQYAPLAEETALRDRHILYQAAAHRGWALLHRLRGEHTRAETRLQQALKMFEGQGTRWQIGRTLYELGELSQSRKDTARARDYFSRALALFKEMQAVPDMVRTQSALESLG